MPPTIQQQISFGANQASLNRISQQIQSTFGSNPINLNFNPRSFSLPLGRITGNVAEFDKSMEAANARVIAFGASAGALYAVQRGLKSIVSSMIEVEKSLTDINVIANLSDKSLAKFSNGLFDIAKNTGQSFKVVADAATEFSRQGLTVEETLKRTNDALILVRQSGISAEDAVSSLTAILNSFDDTALTSTKIVNKLATVDAAFAVSSKDLTEGFKRVGSTAKDVGVDFDQLLAIIAATQERTARGGAVIGNSLKTIFTRIQRTSVLDQLEDLGIAVRDLSTGDALSAITILDNLAEGFSKLNQAQQSKVSESVAGVFQINVFKSILDDLASSTSAYDKGLQIASKNTDEAIQRNIKLNQTIDAIFNRAANNVTQLSSTFGTMVFDAPIRQNLQAFNALTESLTQDSEGTGFKIASGIAKGIGQFLSGPGAALFAVIVTKLALQFATFTGDVLKKLATINLAEQERMRIQEAIKRQLAAQPGLQDAIIRGQITKNQLQTTLLALLEKEAIVRTRIASTIQSQSSSLRSAGVVVPSATSNATRLPRTGGGFNRFPTFAAKKTTRAKGGFGIFGGIKDAVKREKQSGIPSSAIRVGSDKRLISSQNPFGIGIYNTIDEPKGLSQGIERELAAGNNPKKSGMVPSFANNNAEEAMRQAALLKNQKEMLDVSKKQLSQEKKSSDQKAKSLKSDSAKFSIGSAQRSQIFNQSFANKQFSPFAKNAPFASMITTTQDALRQFKSNIKKVSQGMTVINPGNTLHSIDPKQIVLEEKRDFNRQMTSSSGGMPVISGNAIVAGQLEQAREELRKKNAEIRRQGAMFDSNVGQRQSGGMPIVSGTNLRDQIAAQQSQRSQIFEQAFNRPSSPFALQQQSPFSQNAPFAGRIAQAQSQISTRREESRAARKESMAALGQRLAFASFLAPIIGGIVQEQIGSETLTQRRGQSVTKGVTDTLAFAGTGALIGGPWGAAIGALGGAVLAANNASKKWGDTLPDLQKRLQALNEDTQKRSDIVAEFLKISEKLSNPKLKEEDFEELTKQQAELFTGSKTSTPFSEEQISKLIEAFAKDSEAKKEGANDGEGSFIELFKEIQREAENLKKATEASASIASILNKTKGFFGASLAKGGAVTEEGKNLAQVIKEAANAIKDPSGKSLFERTSEEGINAAKVLQLRLQGNVSSLLEPRVQEKISMVPGREGTISNLNEVSQDQLRIKNVQASLIGSFVKAFEEAGSSEFAAELKKALEPLSPQNFRLVIQEIQKTTFGKEPEKQRDDVFKALLEANKKRVDEEKKNSFNVNEFRKNINEIFASSEFTSANRSFQNEDILQSTRSENEIFAIKKQAEIDLFKNSTNEMVALIRESELKAEIERRKTNESLLANVLRLGEQSSNFGSATLEKLKSDPNALGAETIFKFLDEFRSSINDFVNSSDKENFDFNKFNEMVGGFINKTSSQSGMVDRGLVESLNTELRGVQLETVKAEMSSSAVQTSLIQSLERLRVEQENNTRALQDAEMRRRTFNVAEFKQGQSESLSKSISEEAFRRREFNAGVGGSDELRISRAEIRTLRRRGIGGKSSAKEEITGVGQAFRDEFSFNRVDYFDKLEDSAIDVARTMRSEFSSAFKSFRNGALDAGEMFEQFAIGVLEKIADITTEMAFDSFAGSIAGLFSKGITSGTSASGFNRGGKIQKFSTGGSVEGGSGLRDDVPALLQAGEYVIRKQAVEKLGTEYLDRINSGKSGVNVKLDNDFVLDDPKRPTKGEFNVSPFLSTFGQTEEINRQNVIKFKKEEDLRRYLEEKASYDKNKKDSLDAYEQGKKNRLYSGLISAAVGVAGAGISAYAGSGTNAATSGTNTSGISSDSGFSNYGVSYSNTYGSSNNSYSIGYAKGGNVLGPSSPRDNVPVLLTGGEYVIKKSVVDRHGKGFFDRVNRGSVKNSELMSNIQRRAEGGIISPYSNTSSRNIGNTFQSSEQTLSIETIVNAISSAISQSLSSNPNQQQVGNSQSNSKSEFYINITMNSDGSSSSNVSSNQSGDNSESSNDKNKRDREMAKLMESMTIKTISDQLRPGGIIYNAQTARK